MNRAALKQANSLSRDDLHGYQHRAVGFITSRASCALWCEMGLGKTVITLTALADMFDRFEIGRVLIIAPLRVARHTWPEEIARWSHTRHLTHALILGNWGQRVRALAGDEDIHIINRENVTWLVEHQTIDRGTILEWPYDMVVVDEASSFKSPKSQRFKALKKTLPRIERLVELTGTPACNGLLDIWAQIYLVDRGKRLGKTFGGFCERYFVPDYMRYNWTPCKGSEAEIHERLRDVCLTLSAKDYLELPARVDTVVHLDFSPRESEEYRGLEKRSLLELERATVAAFDAATLSNKLLQYANGAVYTDDKGTWSAVHQHKLDALEDIIAEACGQPVLVAYTFKSDKARILKRFKSAVTIDADGVIERWNAGEIPILLAHPASAGHGLNLQSGGNIVVWYGLNWSLELYQQLNARLHRQGQEKPVFVHHLVMRNTVDETVLEALGNKDTTQKALLNALKQDIARRAECTC